MELALSRKRVVVMKTKKCCKCGSIKPISEFHKNRSRKDGHCYQCKVCVKKRQQRYYDKNRNHIKERQRVYDKENREALRERWNNETEKRKERFPLKISARNKVQSAVLLGKITKPEACEICGETPDYPLHGHHEDYSKPLEVIWLCSPCHRDLHRERNRIKTNELTTEVFV